MNKQTLPVSISTYIEGSNKYDMDMYLSAFSDSAMIEEKSIGQDLKGKVEIQNYFLDYFINYQTHTEIIEYKVKENVVDMRVLFKGSFPGNEIMGFYQFWLEDGKIIKLVADLE
ncbi:nuclear transport factor 2 family protein [Paenibacillus sp. sgz500958]|uniref:nuclear transport factor 2 family protein n=1 Tax=Paenibacillus sp. sgz500958 TaxID=3242475 RepID=UPI0036D266FD